MSVTGASLVVSMLFKLVVAEKRVRITKVNCSSLRFYYSPKLLYVTIQPRHNTHSTDIERRCYSHDNRHRIDILLILCRSTNINLIDIRSTICRFYVSVLLKMKSYIGHAFSQRATTNALHIKALFDAETGENTLIFNITIID